MMAETMLKPPEPREETNAPLPVTTTTPLPTTTFSLKPRYSSETRECRHTRFDSSLNYPREAKNFVG